jgi:hypothetical protein
MHGIDLRLLLWLFLRLPESKIRIALDIFKV